jgi:hypothetical protein
MPDHARIGLDIWGDDEWLDLTPEAQHLYFVLKTQPPSFCGSGDWHPGKIAAKASGWTADAVRSAAQVLVDGLFLLIDVETEEWLLRSWIKHDGLFKVPNMAVSMANARSLLSSRLLRGVVVYEVKKLQVAHPDLTSWARDAVATMLTQKAVDPSEVEWPKVAPNPPSNPPPNGWVNPSATELPNPGVNPGPTPSPTPSPSTPLLHGGYESSEGHQSVEPPSRCPTHINWTEWVPACGACAAASRTAKQWRDDEVARKRRTNEALAKARRDCPDCDPNGMVETPTGLARCPKHLQEVS